MACVFLSILLWTVVHAISTSTLTIDTFKGRDRNNLNAWHGPEGGLSVHQGAGFIELYPSDADEAYHTQLDQSLCFNLTAFLEDHKEDPENDALKTNPKRSLKLKPGTKKGAKHDDDDEDEEEEDDDEKDDNREDDDNNEDDNDNGNEDQDKDKDKKYGPALHLVFTGTTDFSISLTQNNVQCSNSRTPLPSSWDSVLASRYASISDHEIYVPLSHFNVDLTRLVDVVIHGFYNSSAPSLPLDTEPAIKGAPSPPKTDTHNTDSPMAPKLRLYRINIVPSIPKWFHQHIPEKKQPTGTLHLTCTVPGSFAFGIDDGHPQLAGELMKVLEEEDVKVTFFVVGRGLRDKRANFSGVYTEMVRKGHQVGLHSESHEKLESLNSTALIDNEITQNIEILKESLNIETTFFRPPFGTVGARTRTALASHLPNAHIILWSVDIEDWRWAGTDAPEKQLEAFKDAVLRGGNLAVLHYLHPSTVGYFREAVKFVRQRGLRVMRVDECLGLRE